MAQIKAHQNHQGIVKGQVYKIYDRDDEFLYLEDHLNYGRVVQYPIIKQANHNEKTTSQTPESLLRGNVDISK